MPATTPTVEMEVLPSHVVITLHPSLNEKQWTDIEEAGSKVVRELETRDGPICLIDLSPLNYVGSAMVAFIVRLWKVVKEKNGRMAVVCRNEFVLGVLQLAALDKLWPIAPNRDAGLRALKLPRSFLREATASPGTGDTEEFPVAEAAERGMAAVVVALLGLAAAVATVLFSGWTGASQQVLKGLVFGGGGVAVLGGILALTRGQGWPRPLAGVVAAAAALFIVVMALAGEVSLGAVQELFTPSDPAAQQAPEDANQENGGRPESPTASEKKALENVGETDGDKTATN